MQDFGQTSADVQLLLDDGDEHINADGNPDLGLHRVLGSAEERLDPQVLLDPLEEQLQPASGICRAARSRLGGRSGW